MKFDLRTARAKSVCKTCGTSMSKGTKYFQKIFFVPGFSFPVKENICLDCCESYSNPEFLKQLKRIITELEKLNDRRNNA